MKQRYYLLLALLSTLTFMMTTTLVCAEDKMTGHVEVGISGMDIDDNPARVNEYVETSDEENPNVNPALDLGIDYVGEDAAVKVDVDYKGSDSYDMSTSGDIKRIFRFDIDYQKLEHWKDHETLDQMGATAREDTGGSQPSVTTDKIFAELAELDDPVTSVGGTSLPYDAAKAYSQELNNDYIVTREEITAETSLALPVLPNIVFHAGLRIETRQGLEQAIGLSKCDGCHVSASGKNIDEKTEEYRFGATGKFGPLTVKYDYMTRNFDEDGATPSRFYDVTSNGSANDQILYASDYFEYNRTPDSEKDTHHLKARYDFSSYTTLSGSYTQSDVESNKSNPSSDISYSLKNNKLKTEFESFGGKLATRYGNWRFSARANTYSIDADNNTVELRSDLTTRDDNGYLSFDLDQKWEPAEERDVDEFGLDVVYRITRGTTLRLGYEYEKVDRDDNHLGETKTNTFKVALKSRLNPQLSGRVSYQYDDIDDPLSNATGIAQNMDGATQDPLNSGLWYADRADYFGIENNSATTVWYWNSVYPNRTEEASNLPDKVHEVKLNTTWSPRANVAATLFARYRYEDNDDVGLDHRKTFVPGVSLWYAPSDKVNLTMSYTYNWQETENKMCVGWYHG